MSTVSAAIFVCMLLLILAHSSASELKPEASDPYTNCWVSAVGSESRGNLENWGAHDALHRESVYCSRLATVKALHRAIDGFLARGLCRLDGGTFCRFGRDGQPWSEGRSAFSGSDGEWAISGHSGDSEDHTRFLFDAAFRIAPGRVCEVGFNAGHSAITLMIAAKPNATYLAFDLPRLNEGANEELFELVKLWLGAPSQMDIRWGNAGETIPKHLDSVAAQTRENAVGAYRSPQLCDIVFYDGAHDVISVLDGLMGLRKMSNRAKSFVILDDVRCDGALCGHSTVAWDFLIWAGIIEEGRCARTQSKYTQGSTADFGACVGRYRWGQSAARCSVFDAWCVARSYSVPYELEKSSKEWLACCFGAGSHTRAGDNSLILGH